MRHPRAHRRDHDEQDPFEQPLAVASLAGALISTVGQEDALDILIGHFGWDLTFRALHLLTGDEADQALYSAVKRLGSDQSV
ncbi:hypothetical protein [Euzebya tangerina]|uniref:hypothetical protein n=1 Tax=Euzebya tangerina TaxID=591198 RepID=UPI000E31CA75|nr:hypothetical protein [Euzebya tangerina]